MSAGKEIEINEKCVSNFDLLFQTDVDKNSIADSHAFLLKKTFRFFEMKKKIGTNV